MIAPEKGDKLTPETKTTRCPFADCPAPVMQNELLHLSNENREQEEKLRRKNDKRAFYTFVSIVTVVLGGMIAIQREEFSTLTRTLSIVSEKVVEVSTRLDERSVVEKQLLDILREDKKEKK
jgi:hypothetical protein